MHDDPYLRDDALHDAKPELRENLKNLENYYK